LGLQQAIHFLRINKLYLSVNYDANAPQIKVQMVNGLLIV